MKAEKEREISLIYKVAAEKAQATNDEIAKRPTYQKNSIKNIQNNLMISTLTPLSSCSSESKKNKKVKWSDEDLEIIYSVIAKFKTSSLKAIRAYLESKHQITVSEGVLSKMRKGEY